MRWPQNVALMGFTLAISTQVFSTLTFAQLPPLHGVRDVSISVSRAGAPKPDACRPTDDELEASVKYVLANSPIRVSPTPVSKAKLDVTYNFVAASDTQMCAYHVSISIWIPADVRAPNISGKFAVLLFQVENMGMAGSSEVGNAVTRMTEQLAKHFVVKWSEQNQ